MENQTQGDFKGKGALDAFLNLFVLISLGWLSISVGGILFNVINKIFSTTTYMGYGYDLSIQSGLKMGIASAVILLPVFLVLINVLHKEYRKGKLNSHSGIHRWLTYVMLLISALTVIGSLVALIMNFLNGEYTANVMLKILVVLIIALLIFGYFGYDLRRKSYGKKSVISMIALIVVLVIGVGSIVGAFFLIDSPQTAKLKNFDMTRTSDLSNMNSYIISTYTTNNKKLPDPSDPKLATFKDPQTKTPYEYKVLSANSYEMCANFAVAVPAGQQDPNTDDWYNHLAGRQCFDKTITDTVNGQIKPVPLR